MLQMRVISVHLMPLANGNFFVYGTDTNANRLDVTSYKYLLFNRHKESYYGTMVEETILDGMSGLIISSWQLVTLFAEEGFNRVVEWEWDQLANLCLSSAHAIYDAIIAKEWHPDFTQLNQENSFRWSLPKSVIEEFGQGFWESSITQDGEDWSVKGFIIDLFHYGLESYFQENETVKYLLGEKLELLKNHQLSGQELAAYFDETRWLESIGIKEDPTPFTFRPSTRGTA